MDALIYFFFNLALHNVLLALVTFLLGLLLGWLLWGKFKNQIDTYIAEQREYEGKIAKLKVEKKELERNLGDNEELKMLKVKYDSCKSDRTALEADRDSDRKIIAELRSKDQKSANEQAGSGQLNEDLAACRKKCADLEAERSGLQSEIAALSAAASARVEAIAPVGSTPAPQAFFAEELTSGKMKKDDQYGLLYTSAPDQVDDLTKIKGVAGVLNEKLNGYGVYTYRQIAIWTPEICEDFSDRLSFKGRIQRDNWIGQCKDLHQDKYGEEI